MIEGIEVLSSYMTYVFDFNMKAFFITYIIIGVILVAIYIKGGSYDDNIFSIILAILLISIIPSLLVGAITPTSRVQEYKVTTSDDVSLNDFIETYEIIDIDGKIYTIREKD